MIKYIPLHKLIAEYEFVPQAIIDEPVFVLAKRYGGEVEKGSDDFDDYEGSGAYVEGTPFAVMHYMGHPQLISTIYLPFEIQNVEEISRIIFQITKELGILDKIKWQRKDEFRRPHR